MIRSSRLRPSRVLAPLAARRRIARVAALLAPLAAFVLALALAPAVAGAAVRQVEPARAFRRQVRGIDRLTPLAILLPDAVAIDVPHGHGIEAKWRADRTSWELSLGIGPRCGGANACFVGSFAAQRGAVPTYRRRLRLRGGVTGWFKPTTCGASCSPPAIQWRRGAVLHSIEFREAGKGSDRVKLVRLANSALAAGPR